MASDAADKFHAHLDACEQCREHPFALCRTGSNLLGATSLDEAMAAGARVEARVDARLRQHPPVTEVAVAARRAEVVGRVLADLKDHEEADTAGDIDTPEALDALAVRLLGGRLGPALPEVFRHYRARALS